MRAAWQIVPGLFQSIRDRVSFGILRGLDLHLQETEQHIAAGTGDEAVSEALQHACVLVGNAFQSLETSLVLEDRLRTPNRYDVVATTFPKHVSKTSYVAGEPGLTPWVLQNQRPVDVFDLACFEQDRLILEARYPGINWSDRDHVLEIAADKFKPPATEDSAHQFHVRAGDRR